MASALSARSSRPRFGDDLWRRAVESLSEEERQDVDFTRTDKLGLLEDVLVEVEKGKQTCIAKRWKYRKGGHDVIIRDKLEKVITWVNKFKDVGDTVMQYDPGHASLPWAGVRLILQITVNDSQIYGAMIDGVEHISNLITRYAILETIYLHIPSNAFLAAHGQLQDSITKLYAAILIFLGKAKRYYQKNTSKRLASAIVQTPASSVELYLEKIKAAQVEVDACLHLIDAEKNQNAQNQMRQLQDGLERLDMDSLVASDVMAKLEEILCQLDCPINRQATQIAELRDDLNKKQRQNLLLWLSKIPHKFHHKAVGTGILTGSGQWLLHKKEFMDWRKSSVSSVLWLHGIPGSGKTRLVYSIIEHLLEEGTKTTSPAPLAFFYCLRAEGERKRADPDEIMRSILKQLSCTKADLPIREPVARAYKERKEEADDIGSEYPTALTVDECGELIVRLLEDNPATIIIDAMDECDAKRRYELFRALDNIIQKSPSLVKVFISSREDTDIVCRLENSQNILISATDNGEDIERFVYTEVEKAMSDKRLLGGVVSQILREKIVDTLIDGAQGMFRWVSLQIDNLCDPDRMKHASDVEKELGRLPRTLHDSYRIVHERIKTSGPTSKSIADRVIAWLLCACDTLSSDTFIDAISVDLEGNRYEISQRDLLNMCCNLVIWDKASDCFRFAHLSVQEYFQSQKDYDEMRIHEIALTRCIDVFLLDVSLTLTLPQSELRYGFVTYFTPTFRYYAIGYCGYHRDKAGDLKCRNRVKQSVFRDSQNTPTFQVWTPPLKTKSERRFFEDYCSLSGYRIYPPLALLFFTSKLGWIEVFEHHHCHKRHDLNREDHAEGSPSSKITIDPRVLDIINWILESGAVLHSINGAAEYPSKVDDTSQRNCEALKQLLATGADVNAVDSASQTFLSSLGFARKTYYTGAARHLLSANVDPDIVDNSGINAPQVLLDMSTRYEIVSPMQSSPSMDDVELRLSRLTDANKSGNHCFWIMHWAQTNGYTNVVRSLLWAKYPVNAVDDLGRTVLNRAAFSGKLEIVKAILECEGVDVNLASLEGWAPLCSATQVPNPDIIKTLVDAGADVNYHVDGQSTALYQAAESGNLEIVNILIESGADVNLDMSARGAALRHRAESGNLEVFTNLLMSGGALDTVDRLCHTALHIAAKNGHQKVVEALLAAHANVDALNNFGWTAGDLAAEWGHSEVSEMLFIASGQRVADVRMGFWEGKKSRSIPEEYSTFTSWRFREWDEDDEESEPSPVSQTK